MLVSQQHHSKQPSYQTAADNQNACTLVKTAKAAEDSASVICSRFDLLTEVPLIHTNWEADPCLCFLLQLIQATIEGQKYDAGALEKKKISINATFWYQFATLFFKIFQLKFP